MQRDGRCGTYPGALRDLAHGEVREVEVARA